MATARLIRQATLDPVFAKQLDQIRSSIPVPSIQPNLSQSSAKLPLHMSPIFKSLKRHPGQFSRLSSNDVRLPEQLRSAMVHVLRDHDYRQLRAEIPKFRHRVYNRSFPIEPDLRSELLSNFEEEAKARLKPPNEDEHSDETEPPEEADKMSTERRIQSAARFRLRQLMKVRTRLDMSDERTRVLYLMSRLAPEYAAVYRVLHELRARAGPGFRPRSLLDFGSGVGSVAWVANALWTNAIFEHLLVDTSARMNELARALLTKSDPSSPTCFPNVYTREFLPLAHKDSRHDLVVSAFTLLELLNQRTRLHSLERLWLNTAPGGHLVLLENGTSAGFQAISEARAFLLNLAHERRSPIALLAPCPHARECPLLTQTGGTGKRRVCAFESSFTEIDLLDGSEQHGRLLYSYLVFQKPAETASGLIPVNGLRGPSPLPIVPIEKAHAEADMAASSKIPSPIQEHVSQTPNPTVPLETSCPASPPPTDSSLPSNSASPSTGATATAAVPVPPLSVVESNSEFSPITPAIDTEKPTVSNQPQSPTHRADSDSDNFWSPKWPRLVCRDASLASGLASLILCCSDGALRSCSFSRGGTRAAELFFAARYSSRGDSLPIDVPVWQNHLFHCNLCYAFFKTFTASNTLLPLSLCRHFSRRW